MPSRLSVSATNQEAIDVDDSILFRLTKSLSDLDSIGITHYHREMVSCIANRMTTGQPIFDANGNPALGDCGSLSLKKDEWDSE
jgi:hypothetical protein